MDPLDQLESIVRNLSRNESTDVQGLIDRLSAMPSSARRDFLLARCHFEVGDDERGRAALERAAAGDDPVFSLAGSLAMGKLTGDEQAPPHRAGRLTAEDLAALKETWAALRSTRRLFESVPSPQFARRTTSLAIVVHRVMLAFMLPDECPPMLELLEFSLSEIEASSGSRKEAAISDAQAILSALSAEERQDESAKRLADGIGASDTG